MAKSLLKFQILSAFLTVFFCSPASVAQPTQTQSKLINLDSLAMKFHMTMVQCPEKIWPRYSWNNVKLFLSRPSTNQAWLKEGSSPYFVEAVTSSLPRNVLTAAFHFFEVDGQKALSLNIENDYYNEERRLVALGAHEFFHYHGQDDWVKRSGSNRMTLYPVDSTARIYRRMLLERLVEYYLSKGANKESLAKASYWFKKWKSEFPEEDRNTTDGYEGTARYVDMLAGIISDSGCQASDDNLWEQLKNTVSEEFRFYVDESTLALDSEGYGVGGLASLILRLIEKNPTWYDEVKTGKTPVEILLGGISPLPDYAPQSIMTAFRQSEAKNNQEYGDLLGNQVNEFLSPAKIRISTPHNALTSTYSPIAFLGTNKLPSVVITPMYRPLSFKTASTEINSKEKAVFFSSDEDPCYNSGGFTLLSDSTEVTFHGTRLSLKMSKAEGEGAFEVKTDAKGLIWHCMK